MNDHDTEFRRITHQVLVAARSGDIERAIQVLHRALDSDVGLISADGNVLASAPRMVMWDSAEIQSPANASEFVWSAILVDEEQAAMLVARTPHDPDRLLPFAGDIIGMELSRLRAWQEGRRELARQVVSDVLSGAVSPAESDALLTKVGLDPARSHRVLAVRTSVSTERMSSALWSVRPTLSMQSEPYLRTIVDERLIMIVPDDRMVERIAATMLQRMHALDPNASVGVSGAYAGAGGLRAGYHDAIAASGIGPGVQYSDTIQLAQILIMTNTSAPLDSLSRRMLAPLLDYDAKSHGELVKTLRTYLRLQRRVKETAEALFIHRNTLRYRLQQIQDLLVVDLEDTETSTNLWLALLVLSSA